MSLPPTADGHLTPRQVEILALLAAGHTYASAAIRLGRTETTVRQQLHRAYQQLGVRTATQAVSWAYLHGQLPLLRGAPLERALARLSLLRTLHTPLTPLSRSPCACCGFGWPCLTRYTVEVLEHDLQSLGVTELQVEDRNVPKESPPD